MSNTTRTITLTAILIAGVLLGAIAVGAFSAPTEREQKFIELGSIREQMSALNERNDASRAYLEAEKERVKKIIDKRGEKWDELNQQRAEIEDQLFIQG